MGLPVAPNTTCDIYRYDGPDTGPPNPPDVPGVPIHLIYQFPHGQRASERGNNDLTWTHVALVALMVDLRDAYTGNAGYAPQDALWIPDQNGTRFNVIFIERVDRGNATDHKRVYLDRQAPSWPTNQV